MKYIKKQNKIIYSIAKKSGSRRDLKTKNIKTKDSKKRIDLTSNSSRYG